MRNSLLLMCCLFALRISAQTSVYSVPSDPEKYYRERQADMQHLFLQLSFVPDSGIVRGKASHRFQIVRPSVDSLFFDAPGIRFNEVRHNGKAAKFKVVEKGVVVFLNQPRPFGVTDSIFFDYEAKPRKGIYFIGWNDPSNRCRKQIWTQGQGIDNRQWIPCYDDTNDKLITEVSVTFDKKFKVLSNGTKLKEKDLGNGFKQWHYKMQHPHSVYLLMLGIGEYDIKEIKSASGVPIRLWYYPDQKDRVEPTYRFSKEMFDFFEKEIGVPYPWESYSQIPVQDFMYGAMENTTATVFGDFFLNDARGSIDRTYVGVNAHELAHQWFGDLVTARSDPHHWLQESFATHYNMLYESEAFGKDYYDYSRRNAYQSSLEASKKDKYAVAHSQGGSPRHYQKGASVLHMLKYVIGREGYNLGVANYLKRHAYSNVDSHDLLNALEDATGQSLGWFWDQWVYKGGEPSYQVSFSEKLKQDGSRAAVFLVNQVQELNDLVGLFKMPIEFEVHLEGGEVVRKREWIERAAHEVELPLPAGKKIAFVLFDPNSQILKSVQFEKPLQMLVNQAAASPFMMDRFDAWVALQKQPLSVKQDLMLSRYKSETYHVVRSEIVRQAAVADAALRDQIFSMAQSDRWPEVRKTFLSVCSLPSPAILSGVEKMLADSSYDVVSTALEKLIGWNPASANSYLSQTKGVEGSRAKSVAIKWHEMNYLINKDATSLSMLEDYSSVSFEFQTRNGAFQALKKLGVFNKNTTLNAIQAALSSNNRLSGPAADYLRYFATQHEQRSLIRQCLNELNKGTQDYSLIYKIIQES